MTTLRIGSLLDFGNIPFIYLFDDDDDDDFWVLLIRL